MNGFLRKLPMLAALITIGVVLFWLDNNNDFKREIFPPRSLHNISPKGASLAFRYLKETRDATAPAVTELHRLIDFAQLEPNAVVLRLGPEIKPGERLNNDPNKSGKSGSSKPKTTPAGSTVPAGTTPPPAAPWAPKIKPPTDGPLLTDGEMKWVKSGGRLVLALDKNYGPIEIVEHNDTFRLEKTFDFWPGINSFRPGGSSYAQPWPARSLKSPALDQALTLFTLNDGIFAARLAVGDGEVIALAAPEMFANSHLADGDNLKLLMQLAPPTRPIYFDEYVHGMKGRPGIIELLMRWGLGMALVVMCVGSVVLFWRARTPVGPPEDDHKETRTEAIDFVNSLAPLYNRALEPHQAIALHYKNFIHAVTAQSSLRGPELRERIFSLLGTSDENGLSGKRALTAQEFYSLLKTLNDAYGRLERAHRR